MVRSEGTIFPVEEYDENFIFSDEENDVSTVFTEQWELETTTFSGEQQSKTTLSPVKQHLEKLRKKSETVQESCNLTPGKQLFCSANHFILIYKND